MSQTKIDPITLEVMRNAFNSIADEMNTSLVRASYSTNIKDRRDCSCAIYTTSGDVVAQSESGTPLHLGTMHAAVHTAMAVYPLEDMEPGDAIAYNVPYPAGPGHLNDMSLISPVYHEGRVIAIAANQAHHVDMGGYAPGSMPFGVTEIYQEGLQVPPVKMFKRGRLDRDLWAVVAQNVRTPFEGRGDLEAQFAANAVGELELNKLGDKYGVDTVGRYQEELLNYSERRMRSALRALPDGTYEFEGVLEGDGIDEDLHVIRTSSTAKGDEIKIDFTETEDAVRGPLNCRLPSVAACVYYVLRAVLDPDLPANSGAYRPIEVVTREGSILSATYPQAVCNANIVTTQRVVDTMIGALSQAVPDRVLAASSGTKNLLNIGGIHPRSGEYFQYIETYAGGQGAMPNQDGQDAVQNHMTNTRNAPVEVLEVAYPLRVEAYGLVPDTEGAGKYRGGVGMVRSMRVLADEVMLTQSSDRREKTPWGLFGGLNATGMSCTVFGPDGTNESLRSKVTTYVDGDRLIRTQTPGGGGWGDPRERDADAVRLDVVEGLVSPQRALDVYGVAIDPDTLAIDESETSRLRNARVQRETWPSMVPVVGAHGRAPLPASDVHGGPAPDYDGG